MLPKAHLTSHSWCLSLREWQYHHGSFQFSHSVISNSLWPHGLQHTRFPYPSPTLGAFSNSRPSNRWCYPAISSSVLRFSWLQSCLASGSFPMSVLQIRWPKYWSFSFSITPSSHWDLFLQIRCLDGVLLIRNCQWGSSPQSTAWGGWELPCLSVPDTDVLKKALFPLLSWSASLHPLLFSWGPIWATTRVLFQNRSREGRKTTGRNWTPIWKMPFR